jgi:flagellar biosynthesis/type III secretory pathway chaperone
MLSIYAKIQSIFYLVSIKSANLHNGVFMRARQLLATININFQKFSNQSQTYLDALLVIMGRQYEAHKVNVCT